jgi:hypothetical protein
MGAAGDAAVAAPTAATTTTPEVLLSVPAELHKVVGGAQHLVARGAFSVAIVSAAGEQRIEARVGDVAWPLSKALPALKAADAIFSFGLEHVRTEYLIVVLEPGAQDGRLGAGAHGHALSATGTRDTQQQPRTTQRNTTQHRHARRRAGGR